MLKEGKTVKLINANTTNLIMVRGMVKKTSKVFDLSVRLKVKTEIETAACSVPKIRVSFLQGTKPVEIFSVEPWFLFKIAIKLFSAAFKALNGVLKERHFQLNGVRLVIGCVEKGILIRFEAEEVYWQLLTTPHHALQLGKIFAESAVVALYQAVQAKNVPQFLASGGTPQPEAPSLRVSVEPLGQPIWERWQ